VISSTGQYYGIETATEEEIAEQAAIVGQEALAESIAEIGGRAASPESIGDIMGGTFGGAGEGMDEADMDISGETEGYRFGTGLEGLPSTGRFLGHEGEILFSPEESDTIRAAATGGVNDLNLQLTINIDGFSEPYVVDKVIPIIRDESRLGEGIIHAEGIIDIEG